MGPRELVEIGDSVESLATTLNSIRTRNFVYSNKSTGSVRKTIAELRSKTNQLVVTFPREAFPIANKAVKRFANKVDTIVRTFPVDVVTQQNNAEELKNIWFLEVRPSIYQLEMALTVTGGVYLPEDPSLFRGKARDLRDIALETNICFRNGACNACSVLLRRLIETMIIKIHQKRGTVSNATDSSGNFYKLEKLIDDILSTNPFSLTRNALTALPHLKRLGDWGAHNRNISVRRTDLEDIKAAARLCFEELLNLT